MSNTFEQYRYRIEDLLKIAEETKAPDKTAAESWKHTDVEFKLSSGWKVFIRYGESDFCGLTCFVTPYGVEINFWEWPSSPEKSVLTGWSGCNQEPGRPRFGECKRLKNV